MEGSSEPHSREGGRTSLADCDCLKVVSKETSCVILAHCSWRCRPLSLSWWLSDSLCPSFRPPSCLLPHLLWNSRKKLHGSQGISELERNTLPGISVMPHVGHTQIPAPSPHPAFLLLMIISLECCGVFTISFALLLTGIVSFHPLTSISY